MNNLFIGLVMFLSIFFGEAFAQSSSKKNDYFETSEYQHVGDNLLEKKGELYFETVLPSSMNSEFLGRSIFIKRFSFYDESKPYVDKTLTEVVDKSSWRRIGWNWYRDKKSLYCELYMTNTPFLVQLNNVDVDSLRFSIGKGWIDIAGLEKLADVERARLSKYFISDSDVFHMCKPVKGVDLNTFRVLNNSEYGDAKDKNHNYSLGRKNRKISESEE